MITYISKSEMIEKFGKNYFGLTQFFVDKRLKPKIYIRNDIGGKWLPEIMRKWVQISILAHEEEHARRGKGSLEFYSWVVGFKACPYGWALSVLLSLTPLRIKMYPAMSSAFILFISFWLLIHFKS